MKASCTPTALVISCALICALFSAPLSAPARADGAPSLAPGAKSAILVECGDLPTGSEGGQMRVIWAKNDGERLSMASTTKIMTALVVLDKMPLDRRLTAIEGTCGIEGSSIYMRVGETFTVEELLYALMLQSANDAAALLAVETAGSIEAFAAMMNEKAAALGLQDTHFENPHGLDGETHYTTARDLAALSCAALSVPQFREIVSTVRRTIGEGESARTLVNHNRMLTTYDGAIGVKTGYTKKSGRCLVCAAERGGVTLVSVTIDDGDDWRDHAAMLDYGFAGLESVVLCEAGELSRELPCVGGTANAVRVANAERVSATLAKDHGAITVTLYAPHFLFAPVTAGDTVGTAVFRCGGREIGRCALTAQSASEYIQKKGFFERLLDLYR